jgi:ABC-type proline/glycine betaine transport system permease subunit
MAETRRAHLKLDSAVDAGLNGTITLHLPMVVIASLYGEKNSN